MLKTHIAVKIMIFGAVSALFMIFLRFPLVPDAPFLKYDPSDIPALVVSFVFGPFQGLTVVCVKEIIFALFKSKAHDIIGIPMDFAVSGVFVFLSGLIYETKKTKTNAMFALSVGIAAMAILMSLLNYFVVPLYMKLFNPNYKIAEEALLRFIYLGIIPFNIIKGAINALITFVIYKKVSNVLR